jgi:L-lactate dehydrogenase complex protein LldG
VTSRAEFLADVRREMARSPGPLAAVSASRPARPADVADTVRRELAERWRETLEGFRREFERVGGAFYRVASIGEVPAVVGRIAREREARQVVTWHPAALGRDLGAALRAEGLEAEAMPPGPLADADERRTLRTRIAAAGLGLTGVDLAIAETGSLLLGSGAGRPRSTSLLPPYHVAIFDRNALVETLAQVAVLLEAWHAGPAPADRGAVITVITGPSRTADIELTLTRGVHGPKEVHAIFVEEPWRE